MAFKIKTVDLDQLNVPTYQRGEKSKIRKMARNWDEDMCGIILVNKRPDGKYYIVDGLQRVSAAKIVGLSTLQAEVHNIADFKEEARLFLARNDRTSMSQKDLYKAALFAEEPEILAVDATLQAHEFFMAGSGRTDGRRLTCPRAVIVCHQKGVLPQVLDFVSKTYPVDGPEYCKHAVKDQFIKGVGLFFEIYGDHDALKMKRLVDQCRSLLPEQALAEGHRRGGGTHAARGVMEQLTERYNVRLAERNRLTT